MRSSSLLITCILSLSFLFFSAEISSSDKGLASERKAIRQMAQVMLNLKHSPSDSEMKMLQHISLNTQNADEERIIATAMMNLHNQVHSTDKLRLKVIINDDSTSPPARTLATIMLNLDHNLSAQDRKSLEELLRH